MNNRTFHALEFSDRISTHGTIEAARQALSQLTSDFGYTSFVLASFQGLETTQKPRVLATNWTREWKSRYTLRNYFPDDPVVAKARKTFGPFHWSDLRREGQLSRRGEEILDDARSFAMPEGIFVPIFGPQGLAGALSVAGEGTRVGTAELKALHLAGIYAYEHFNTLSAANNAPRADLTYREMECLHWTAAGKTSAEIADKLGISRHTTDWYLKEAARKLNALNRTHAVVIAYRRGLIS